VGFDGDTLAFVEVTTRAVAKGKIAQPELSIGREKHQVLLRTVHAFLRERHVKKPPVVRLHKDALSRRA
jgi:Holliday junction resolvase-like predicted endonuclease